MSQHNDVCVCVCVCVSYSEAVWVLGVSKQDSRTVRKGGVMGKIVAAERWVVVNHCDPKAAQGLSVAGQADLAREVRRYRRRSH